MMLGHSKHAVIEFVSPDDPMAQRVVASRPGAVMPYSQELFEAAVTNRAEIVASDSVSATRTMYHVRR